MIDYYVYSYMMIKDLCKVLILYIVVWFGYKFVSRMFTHIEFLKKLESEKK